MNSDNDNLSRPEKKEIEIKNLLKLQEQLRSSDASNRRRAAFNLSWMQEEGLEILKEALLGTDHITTKNAAAYGLRKMRGRMKKIAIEVLNEGLKHHNSSTRQVSRSALQLLGHKIAGPYKEQRSRVRRTGTRRNSRRSGTTHSRLSIIIDSSVHVDQIAVFLGELAELYYEFTDGDELVIREGRIPSGSPISI